VTGRGPVIFRSDEQEIEEMLDDGKLVRKKITTIQQIVPVFGKSLEDDPSAEPHQISEDIVGTEIEEEILELCPGVTEKSPANRLESETSVEEFEETLPDGTWAKRKVTKVTVMLKKSLSRERDGSGKIDFLINILNSAISLNIILLRTIHIF